MAGLPAGELAATHAESRRWRRCRARGAFARRARVLTSSSTASATTRNTKLTTVR